MLCQRDQDREFDYSRKNYTKLVLPLFRFNVLTECQSLSFLSASNRAQCDKWKTGDRQIEGLRCVNPSCCNECVPSVSAPLLKTPSEKTTITLHMYTLTHSPSTSNCCVGSHLWHPQSKGLHTYVCSTQALVSVYRSKRHTPVHLHCTAHIFQVL